jgi:glycosyltransferase involved in cell wall biosynthesis
VAILERYTDRLAWSSERDRGQAHAVNKGWKRAKGDILGWLNSDDVYLPGAVSKAVRYLVNDQEAGVVYGRAIRIAEDGSTIDEYPTEAADHRNLTNRCMICQPAAFLRSHVVRDVGYLDESLNYCIDYDLWIRISQKYMMAYIPEVLAKSRLHADCKTLKHRVATHREACDTLYRHYGFVSPSWIGGYAWELFRTRFERPTAWRVPLILFGALAVGSREFVRYNSRMPPSQFWPWVKGMYRALKKAWK